MNNIEVLDFKDFYILVSKINGNVFAMSADEYKDEEYLNSLLNGNQMNENIETPNKYDKDLFKTIYISLHTSSKCNLLCTYCFRKERDNKNLTFNESKNFIDMIIDEFPNAGKYIVDPTGSGEPLLNKELLFQIGEYCKEKSNEIRKEVLPMIVTNGTLLNKQTVKGLRDSGILFGVSLDGDKYYNDYYRKDYLGNGVYRKVIKNIKNIKDRSLMGVAVTLTDKNIDLVKTVKHLIQYFPTISIKPVRSVDGKIGINEDNIEEIKKAYTKLYEFLVSETRKGNLEYIAALLNGDDYFGKFILRTILGQSVSARCDAGIGRFSLAPDGKIYACPGAIDIDEFIVGDYKKGIDTDKRDAFWKILTERSKCDYCFARFICGGECMVSSYYTYGKLDKVDKTMCELKKHLFKLSLLFNQVMKQSQYYVSIYNACIEKVKRFEVDLDMSFILNNSNEYSYAELNDYKFNNQEHFKRILNELKFKSHVDGDKSG